MFSFTVKSLKEREPVSMQDMLSELLPRVLPACMMGLEDADDDVRAVAAEALTPAAAAIVSSAGDAVTIILLSLWDILLDLDDLSPSTSRSVCGSIALFVIPLVIRSVQKTGTLCAIGLNILNHFLPVHNLALLVLCLFLQCHAFVSRTLFATWSRL